METENQTEDPPEHVATFAELAGILNMSRSTLYDLRRRESLTGTRRGRPDGSPRYPGTRGRGVLFRLEVGRGGGDCRQRDSRHVLRRPRRPRGRHGSTFTRSSSQTTTSWSAQSTGMPP